MTPGPLAQTLDRKLTNTNTTVLAAWNIASPHPTTFVARRRLVDLHIADEFALVGQGARPIGKDEGNRAGKA